MNESFAIEIVMVFHIQIKYIQSFILIRCPDIANIYMPLYKTKMKETRLLDCFDSVHFGWSLQRKCQLYGIEHKIIF